MGFITSEYPGIHESAGLPLKEHGGLTGWEELGPPGADDQAAHFRGGKRICEVLGAFDADIILRNVDQRHRRATFWVRKPRAQHGSVSFLHVRICKMELRRR